MSIATLVMVVAIQAGVQPAPSADAPVAHMAVLFDQLCLRTFPDDAALDAAMAKMGATPLSDDEVKANFNDDPGRGWSLPAGNGQLTTVWLELPPFHACTVRQSPLPADADMTPYLKLTAAFRAANPGFARQPPIDLDREGIHVHAEQDFRTTQQGGESLLMVKQSVIDPARRAKGETGISLRFVYQHVARDAK